MCGRFSQTNDFFKANEEFSFTGEETDFVKSYNIYPSSYVSVINKDKKLLKLKWGKKHNNFNIINLKIENLKKTERLFKNRCLVIASGYYEWEKKGKNKIPYYITIKNKSIFAFAGLYDDDKNVAIITRPPLESISFIHDRMPLIIANNYYEWFNSEIEKYLDNLHLDLLFYTVSDRINKTLFDDESLIEYCKYEDDEFLY